jgi:flagellar biosynthesis protein FliR
MDFVLMGTMLAALCGSVELGARASDHWAFRAGVALAAGAVFLLIWINLAVGIIGSADNPANLFFAGVIAVVAGGAFLAQFRAPGMVRAMHVTAAAQVLVACAAHVMGAAMIFPITAIFAVAWLGAAWLFRQAAN